MSETAVKVENLSKIYPLYDQKIDRLKESLHPFRKKYHHDFYALKEVSFEVKKGETFGIIGKNGSGKSTLLKILSGVLAPTYGTYSINGRIASLLELGTGFNPELTGIENIYFNGTLLGLSKSELDKKFDQVVAFADIGEFINQPVGVYSSGMFVRLAFAVQTHIDASIVIIDEALAVGDVFFRQKCYTRLEQLRNSGTAILLVSHSMPEIEQYCKRALLLDHGDQRFTGVATEATKRYYLLHQSHSIVKVGSNPVIDNNKSLSNKDFSLLPHPPANAFSDITDKVQVTNGQACCTRFAICDTNNQPCDSFRQGDIAVFYYEFELKEDIGIPICGLVISNEKGVIVHGKNSWQYDVEPLSSFCAGRKIMCRQEIGLELSPGEYIFEIGLVGVSEKTWRNRKCVSFEEFSENHIRICHIVNAGMFSVGLSQSNGVSILTHHGIANLPGKIEVISVPVRNQ